MRNTYSDQLEYRIALLDGKAGNVPSSWVIEFSDPVFGNRWTADHIHLTVQGRACNLKSVSSQHDRRFVWAGSEYYGYLTASSWGRGACNSSYPDMPVISCSSKEQPRLQLNTCKCDRSCNNGYCDCGLQSCVCNPGFAGPNCSIDICATARCGPHGKCVSTYLGGTLPVSDSACVCDVGWGGPTCDQNPCLEQSCSGHGVCKSVGDTDWRCSCSSGYSGRICDRSCNSFGCATDAFPYSCAWWPSTSNMRLCIKGCPNLFFSVFVWKFEGINEVYQTAGGGCSYPPLGSTVNSNECCYMNCDSCSQVTCPTASNDCHLAGSCQPNGRCSAETARADGSPCNSQPLGTCFRGVCQSPGTLLASTVPSMVSSVVPVAKPSSPLPIRQSPSAPSTLSPSSYQPISISPYTSRPTWRPSIIPATAGCLAYCGSHGRCAGRYPLNNCTCDAGWTGPICDQYPCFGQACSGHGVCSAVGDTDWRCTCSDGWSGRTCNHTCNSFGCQSNTYAYSCAWWQFSPPTMGLCRKGTCIFYYLL